MRSLCILVDRPVDLDGVVEALQFALSLVIVFVRAAIVVMMLTERSQERSGTVLEYFPVQIQK